jgi:PRTRC genetic system protein B
MEARVVIGANRHFVLKNAVLLYGDGTSMFATLHSVMMRVKNSAPLLGPGQALTMAFLRTLAEGLGARIAAEILPDNVLARTPDMITWWTRARHEVMFFGGVDPEARELDGATYPHPALVFKVTGRELFVRALERDERPTGETPLKTVPYWNCDSAGRVCLGSMRVPDETTVESIAGWQAGFFRSQFSHANGAVRLTSHPGGFIGLWKSLKNCDHPFPTEFLTDAKEALRQFVEGD